MPLLFLLLSVFLFIAVIVGGAINTRKQTNKHTFWHNVINQSIDDCAQKTENISRCAFASRFVDVTSLFCARASIFVTSFYICPRLFILFSRRLCVVVLLFLFLFTFCCFWMLVRRQKKGELMMMLFLFHLLLFYSRWIITNAERANREL